MDKIKPKDQKKVN